MELSNKQLARKIMDVRRENNSVYSSDLRLMASVYQIRDMGRIFRQAARAGLKLVDDEDLREDSRGGRQIDLFRQYMKDCSLFKKLTREETLELSRRTRAGDKGAENLLISCNLRFVISIVRQMNWAVRMGCDRMDLIQAGNIGLMEAVKRYDPSLGYRLRTYAGFWIRMEISRTVRNDLSCVRLPYKVLRRIHRISKARERLEGRGRKPGIDELCAETGYSPQTIRKTETFPQKLVSMDDPPPDTESLTYFSRLKDRNEPFEEQTEIREKVKKVLSALDRIPARERSVLIRNFGIGSPPVSLARIGRETGLSRERVRQIRNKGLNDLEIQLYGCRPD